VVVVKYALLITENNRAYAVQFRYGINFIVHTCVMIQFRYLTPAFLNEVPP
jgi:hypothetical protein